MGRNSTTEKSFATRNAEYLRVNLAKHLGVDADKLPKELSRQTELPYQTIKNFVLGQDYSGRVFFAVFDVLKAAPKPVRKSLAIDYIAKMLPETSRDEVMDLFADSTWIPDDM